MQNRPIFLLSILVFSLFAWSEGQAQNIPAPLLSASSTNPSDGKYQLTVSPIPGYSLSSSEYYIRVNAQEPTADPWSFTLMEWSEDFWTQQPGDYTYTAQICESASVPEECGPVSSGVTVTVGAQAATDVPPENWNAPQPSGMSGPIDFTPGLYRSTLTDYNGWHFNWINSLMWEEHPGLSEEFHYDLTVRWLTYEYSTSEGWYTPIWIWAHLVEIDGTSTELTGVLYYRQVESGEYKDYNIGNLKIEADLQSPNEVDVEWRTQRPGMYPPPDSSGSGPEVNDWVSDTLEYADSLGDPGVTSEHDHYQGAWRRRISSSQMDRSFTLETWIDAGVEVVNFLFHDANGKPIWAQASGPVGSPGTQLEEFCAYSVFNAHAPSSPPDHGDPIHVGLGCDVQTTEVNVGRGYDPIGDSLHRSAVFWANVQLPAYRPGSLVIGSQQNHEPIEKWTHFHDIQAISRDNPAGDTCYFEPGSDCEFSLQWHLAGSYPDAAIFRKTLPAGPIELVSQGIDPADADYPQQSNSVGTYEFQIRRTGNSSSTLIAKSKPFSIVEASTESPPSPAADPEFSSPIASSKVGSTRGTFEVTESGAATYTIPVLTVPGSGGMAPEIRLDYNSQAGASNMGRGWQIGGLSSISRCGQTLEAGDGQSVGVQLNSDDRFCLDGQRMILVEGPGKGMPVYGEPGTVYRLESDRYIRVTAEGSVNGGPAYFIVERKDGTKSVYGTSDSSSLNRIVSPGSGVVFAWPITRIMDSALNYIEFDYGQVFTRPVNPPLEWFIDRIRYTGNDALQPAQQPYAEIKFNYESFPAGERRFQNIAGVTLQTSKRLVSIDSVKYPDDWIRQYRFEYMQDGHGRSLLTSIRECWDDAGPNCLSPTTFTWNDSTLMPDFPSGGGDLMKDFKQGKLSDVNGDGLTEYIYLQEYNDTLRFRNFITSVNAYGTIIWDQPDCGPYPLQCARMTHGDPDLDNPPAWTTFDLSGNGFSDIVYAIDGDVVYHAWQGHGFGTPNQIAEIPSAANPGDVFPADWDGDGRTDLVIGKKRDEGDPVPGPITAIQVLRNTSQNGVPSLDYTEVSIDYDLAGDYSHLPNCYGASICQDGGQGYIANNRIWTSIVDGQVADFTGDGRVEFLVQVHGWYCAQDPCNDPQGGSGGELEGGEEKLFAFYALMRLEETANGPRMVIHELIGHPTESMVGANNIQFIRSADFNGDGLSDLLYRRSSQGWFLRINTGNGFDSELSQPDLNVIGKDQAKAMRFAPVSGAGVLDIIAVEKSGSTNYFRHFEWSWNAPGWVLNPNINDTAAPLDQNQWLFTDLTGNGKVDTVRLKYASGDDWTINKRPGLGGTGNNMFRYGYEGFFRIFKITDGLGAFTRIRYAGLAHRAVHTRDNNAPYTGYGAGSAVHDVMPSIHVVSEVNSLAPKDDGAGSVDIDAETTLRYYYVGAKIQGGGRGFLGFHEVASFDEQSRILTRTAYHQDFPLIGYPSLTRTFYISEGTDPWEWYEPEPLGTPPNPPDPVVPCYISECENPALQDDGILLSESETIWTTIETDSGLPHPYRLMTVEDNYIPVYSSNGSDIVNSERTHTVVSEYADMEDSLKEPDIYGNPKWLRTTTYAGSGALVSRKTSHHEYDNHPDEWHLGRLRCSIVESSDDIESITRVSTFEYDEDTGILISEVTRQNDCAEPEYLKKMEYDLDSHGNRKFTTVTGVGLDDPRRTMKVYDERGRFVNEEQVYLDNWVTVGGVTERDRYGNIVSEYNAQGITTLHYYDYMGRPHYSFAADGSWTRQLFSFSTTGCPIGTVFKVIETQAGGRRSETCKDLLGRESRNRTQGFSGEWIHQDTAYDYASRPVRVSEPYMQGSSQTEWTSTVYDEVGRIEFLVQPDGGVIEQSYTYYNQDGIEGVQTAKVDALNKMHRTINDVLGNKRLEIAADGGKTHYQYDPLGRVVSVDGPLANDDTVQIYYDALGHKERLLDPDKGEWHYRHNAAGELMCQLGMNSISGTGDATRIFRDVIGRKVERRDLAGVSDVDSCTGIQRGVSTWEYGLTEQTSEFGQIMEESSQYNDSFGSDHTTTREHFYDDLARRTQTNTTISEPEGDSFYTEHSEFDEYGRKFQDFDASGDDRGVRYIYNQNGYLKQLRESRLGSVAQTYWTVLEMDARGNVTKGLTGNGIEVLSTYDPQTGALTHRVDDAGATQVQNIQLNWDQVGNLISRLDMSGSSIQEEAFYYDDRHRLKRVEASTDGGQFTTAQRLNYDLSGNMTCNTEISTNTCTSPAAGNYTYGQGSAGPHGVSAAGNTSFTYDAKGNVTSDSTGRQFKYTTFQKIRRVAPNADPASAKVEFHYGPDRSRTVKRELTGSTLNSRTHYLRGTEVVWSNTSNSWKYRRYIGGILIATHYEASGISKHRYLHKDHLGSIVAITDEFGQVDSRMSYDAWGKRRNAEFWHPYTEPPQVWLALHLDVTPRGFTGHEHVDLVNIVHMNGRIYDPHFARFLQADPFMEDSTTLNRYTYVHNNPLTYMDPSGYISAKTLVQIFAAVAIGYYIAPLVGPEGVLEGVAAYAAVGAGGAATGYIMTGSLEGTLWSAFAAMTFYGIGQWVEGIEGAYDANDVITPKGRIIKSVSHGLAGGSLNHLQGGKFGHGFVSSGLTAAVSPDIQSISDSEITNISVAALVGGTISRVSGGKFANGAVTSAMAYAFNQVPSSKSSANEITSDQFDLGLEFEVNPINLLKLRGSSVGRALEILGVDMTLSGDGEVALGASGPSGVGAELAYDGNGSFRLTSPVGTVDLQRADIDFLVGPNPPWGPGWEAGFTAQLNPKFVLRGNFLVGSVGVSGTVILTPQQRNMVRDPLWWMQNLSGGAPIGMGPSGD